MSSVKGTSNKSAIAITTSKFNKNIDKHKSKSINLNVSDVENEQTEDEFSSDNTCINEENFQHYIVDGSISRFSVGSNYCQFKWNGIKYIDRWELQRKVNLDHANELLNDMIADFEKFKEFRFIDLIHIGKKKDDDKYYVLDGQHRLEAYNMLCESNKYPIQNIPIVLWTVDNDKSFVDLFQKINNRLNLDKLKLFQIKLLEIFEGLEKKYGKIFGKNRPKINKDKFIDNLNDNDNVHNLSTEEILDKLIKINENIRSKPRTNRVQGTTIPMHIHRSADDIDFFLGLDKQMKWVNDI